MAKRSDVAKVGSLPRLLFFSRWASNQQMFSKCGGAVECQIFSQRCWRVKLKSAAGGGSTFFLIFL